MVNNFIVSGNSDNFNKIRILFPELLGLMIPEKYLLNDKQIPNFPINFVISIMSDEVLHLSNLNYQLTKYIIELDGSIDESTQKLDKIERLYIHSNKINPVYLNKASSLKWLNVLCESKPDKEWYRKLYKSVNEGMQSLNWIDIQIKDDKNHYLNKSLKSAEGKKNILELLKNEIDKDR